MFKYVHNYRSATLQLTVQLLRVEVDFEVDLNFTEFLSFLLLTFPLQTNLKPEMR